jgi:hypothetical protein
MMEPNGRPLDRASAAELVVRVVGDIDRSSADDRDALLSALLCAAWPSHCGQNQ